MSLVVLRLTPAQARMVNSSLAREESEDHQNGEDYNAAVMARTRRAVWDAMEAAGCEP
jgi:hypothetical protein